MNGVNERSYWLYMNGGQPYTTPCLLITCRPKLQPMQCLSSFCPPTTCNPPLTRSHQRCSHRTCHSSQQHLSLLLLRPCTHQRHTTKGHHLHCSNPQQQPKRHPCTPIHSGHHLHCRYPQQQQQPKRHPCKPLHSGHHLHCRYPQQQQQPKRHHYTL